MKKKFNVVLFIVLLIFCCPVGLIYGIVGIVRAAGAKKGVVKADGFGAKMTGGIIGVVFSIIIALCFRGEDGVESFIGVGIAGLALILLAILNRKTNKKIFNLLYLVVLVIYFAIPLPIMMVQIVVGIFLATPTTIGSIFGLIGVMRGFKAKA